MQDLVPIDKTTVLQAFTTGEGMDDFIDSVRSAALSLTDTEKATLDTQVGRSQYASAAAKVARVKTRADTIGKDSIAEAKALIKKVDGNRRYLRERLDDIKAQVRRPLTQWEEQQKAIMEELRSEIERYERLGEEFSSPGHSMDDIEAALSEIEAWTINEEIFGELEIDALKAQRKASQLLGVAFSIESEEARKAAERAAKEREERLKREAEEAERRAQAQEEARIAAEKRAEEERAAADRRIQEAQEAADRREREMKAEATRKAEEQRKAEAMRRQREKAEQEAEKQRKAEAAALLDKHIAEAVESIVNAIEGVALESGPTPDLSENIGKILVQKIIAGDIKHIKFEQQQ